MEEQAEEAAEQELVEEKPEEESKTSEDVNPFKALIGGYNKSEKSGKSSAKEKKEIVLKKDDFIEREHLRPLAAKKAADICFTLFDLYKKVHGMVSYT